MTRNGPLPLLFVLGLALAASAQDASEPAAVTEIRKSVPRLTAKLEEMRGAKFEREVAVKHQSNDDFRANMLAKLDTEYPAERAQKDEKALKAHLKQHEANKAKWLNEVIPKWPADKGSRKVSKLCWEGIPSSVRPLAWSAIIGNDLKLTVELYEILRQRAAAARELDSARRAADSAAAVKAAAAVRSDAASLSQSPSSGAPSQSGPDAASADTAESKGEQPAAVPRPESFPPLPSPSGPAPAKAVDRGGSTLRDYVDATGRAGGYAASHGVYGRGGQPCLRCARSLRSVNIAQRTTVYCPACQPRRG